MIKGQFKVGARMEIKVVPPGMKEMFFTPEVYEIEFYKRISWGGNFMGFVYKGVHDFVLEKKEDNITRFRQVEVFKGPIILLMEKMIMKTAIGYQNMNEEFKRYVENKKVE